MIRKLTHPRGHGATSPFLPDTSHRRLQIYSTKLRIPTSGSVPHPWEDRRKREGRKEDGDNKVAWVPVRVVWVGCVDPAEPGKRTSNRSSGYIAEHVLGIPASLPDIPPPPLTTATYNSTNTFPCLAVGTPPNSGFLSLSLSLSYTHIIVRRFRARRRSVGVETLFSSIFLLKSKENQPIRSVSVSRDFHSGSTAFTHNLTPLPSIIPIIPYSYSTYLPYLPTLLMHSI